MIELCCEYLSVRCIGLYVIIMSRTSFRVNLHSIVFLNVKELLVRLRTKWLWVRITLLSLKLQTWRLLRARSSLAIRQTIECRFTLKLVRDMIIIWLRFCCFRECRFRRDQRSQFKNDIFSKKSSVMEF